MRRRSHFFSAPGTIGSRASAASCRRAICRLNSTTLGRIRLVVLIVEGQLAELDDVEFERSHQLHQRCHLHERFSRRLPEHRHRLLAIEVCFRFSHLSNSRLIRRHDERTHARFALRARPRTAVSAITGGRRVQDRSGRWRGIWTDVRGGDGAVLTFEREDEARAKPLSSFPFWCRWKICRRQRTRVIRTLEDDDDWPKQKPAG